MFIASIKLGSNRSSVSGRSYDEVTDRITARLKKAALLLVLFVIVWLVVMVSILLIWGLQPIAPAVGGIGSGITFVIFRPHTQILRLARWQRAVITEIGK